MAHGRRRWISATIQGAAAPKATPIDAPASTSDGQCTPTAIRASAMPEATRIASQRSRGRANPSATAAPNAPAVSPEGNAKSPGGAMRISGASARTSNGRGRRNTSFSRSATIQALARPTATVRTMESPRRPRPRARIPARPKSHQTAPSVFASAKRTARMAVTWLRDEVMPR
ncbi:MAG: hypothetical protein A3H36_02005 [Chloroflexi bacterium RIFCSPLOWO2_02_FULL_71_16]|nr:MAG: hypothetical protein A3H36_02005 [Chloroflexi bacterium RIFCSPLOWO2_02_FULL_71_16]